MGIPSQLKEALNGRRDRRQFPVVSSPNEPQISVSDNAVKDAVVEGIKTACIAGVVAAVPTLIGCRVLPWAKANLNYTAQALIISAASISGFFITADKTILEGAKKSSRAKFDKTQQ
ncbi:early nodulin-93-like [Wolffia australiana]